MFHDRNLHAVSNLSALAFELNAQAVRLAAMVEWYKAAGYLTLPVSSLKRGFFSRRQWELATKGTRAYDGKKLLDPAPVKDGCEYLGLVSEHREVCPETGTPKTYWVIGEVNEAVLEAIRKERQEAAFDVIEDPKPQAPEGDEVVEPSVKVGGQLSNEAAYDEGYAHGEAAGYDRGVSDTRVALDATGCGKTAPLVTSSKDAGKPHVVLAPDEVVAKRQHIETLLRTVESLSWQDEDALARAASEKHLGF